MWQVNFYLNFQFLDHGIKKLEEQMEAETLVPRTKILRFRLIIVMFKQRKPLKMKNLSEFLGLFQRKLFSQILGLVCADDSIPSASPNVNRGVGNHNTDTKINEKEKGKSFSQSIHDVIYETEEIVEASNSPVEPSQPLINQHNKGA